MSYIDADHAFGLTDDSLSELRSLRETYDQLHAEWEETAIWLDSGYGPPPSMWTDEMWAAYIGARVMDFERAEPTEEGQQGSS